MNKPIKKIAIFIQGFLLLNLIWFAASVLSQTNVLPNPLLVYKSLGNLWADNVILHILYSLRRIAIGLVLSLAAGVPVGILMATSKRWNAILYPLVYLSYPIPKTALLPIAMLLWGMRDGSKIIILFLIIVFQVIVSVRDSVRAIDASMYQVVITVGANKRQIIWHVTLPAILPALLTSVRVSIGTAVAILFFIEGYGTKYGMGYYILDAWSRINYIDMYIGILVIAVVGFALFILLDAASNSLCKWNKGSE